MRAHFSPFQLCVFSMHSRTNIFATFSRRIFFVCRSPLAAEAEKEKEVDAVFCILPKEFAEKNLFRVVFLVAVFTRLHK